MAGEIRIRGFWPFIGPIFASVGIILAAIPDLILNLSIICRIILLILLALCAVGSQIPLILNNLPQVKRIDNYKDAIIKALDMAVYTFKLIQKIECRACIFMLPNKKSKEIEIRYFSSNMKDAKDVGIKFEKYRGCTGVAWGIRKPVIADLTIPKKEASPDWLLTHDQLEMTTDLNTVFSHPISHPYNKNTMIGILSFDSKDAVTDFFQREDIQKLVAEYAGHYARLICEINNPIPLYTDTSTKM